MDKNHNFHYYIQANPVEVYSYEHAIEIIDNLNEIAQIRGKILLADFYREVRRPYGTNECLFGWESTEDFKIENINKRWVVCPPMATQFKQEKEIN